MFGQPAFQASGTCVIARLIFQPTAISTHILMFEKLETADTAKGHLKHTGDSSTQRQIKEQRGFRRFSLRGKENVSREWKLVCAVNNLLKLFRAGVVLEMA
jgi:hypothetical protein